MGRMPNGRMEMQHLFVTRLAQVALVAGIPELDERLLVAHYVVDAVSRQSMMRMLNASYPDKQECCIQSDFREVTIGQKDLAHLTHLGYEHRDYKVMSVHQILREIRSHMHYVREQRLKNEAVQVRVPKVQRERELAEQRSQREAVAMIEASAISDISAERESLDSTPATQKCEPEPEPEPASLPPWGSAPGSTGMYDAAVMSSTVERKMPAEIEQLRDLFRGQHAAA